VDFRDIYADYPLNHRPMDFFARVTLAGLLRRLKRRGLRRTQRILDYGCGNGLFVQFLRARGYRVEGFDPFLPGWEDRPAVQGPFDWVVANDVIEHAADPRALLRDAARRLAPGGKLYVGLPDPDGVRNMTDLADEAMRLHQPFHRVMIPLDRLVRLAGEEGLATLVTDRRSYLDTPWPFANYRFLNALSRAVGHVMEDMFRARPTVLARLILPGLFGYIFPIAEEPSAIFCKPQEALS
jgi:SAM-dependent methyltransferase